MKNSVCFLVACLSVCTVAVTASAKNKPDKGKKITTEAQFGMREPAIQVQWAFSDEERRVIHEYVRSADQKGNGKARQLPPGLAKKVARGGKLPPGWQNKCVVGEIMPAQVYDQCHVLPPEVVVRMPPAPEPTLTVTIGGKVVRLLKATREILDVFDVHVRI